MGKDALAALETAQPSARKAVESAAGYAAFSNFGTKILVAGGGYGIGITVNNRPKAIDSMKMAEVQACLGIGVNKFQLKCVFETAATKSDETRTAYQGALSVYPGCGCTRSL